MAHLGFLDFLDLLVVGKEKRHRRSLLEEVGVGGSYDLEYTRGHGLDEACRRLDDGIVEGLKEVEIWGGEWDV